MPARLEFCSQCGAPVEMQAREGQPRDICPACGAVCFQHPQPVAACVVLNERREVLLVQGKYGRDKQAWSLPMGFARPDEALTEAAVRELKEVAGIESRLIRLLDTDSCRTDEHGDLLIVTLEMQKVGGSERAGAKAGALGYFPLSRSPKLAFGSNEKALRLCADTHLEDWAIRDSFERLQADEAKVMLSDALVALITERAADVARAWLAEVCANPTTTSYRQSDPDKLLERATTALGQFGRWLSGQEADQEVRDFYVAIGRERRAQGFGVHEVLSALMLLRKHVWKFARNHGVWERPIDVYRVLELNRRLVIFFDKAMYHAARAYETTGGS